ncbi:MAG: AraC family transcriptional regulator [Mobilitalea sp.]
MVVVENADFYKGPLNSEEHFHSCCEIFFLKKGRILLNIEGKEYEPAVNSVHIISPMENHSVTCLSEEYERYIIFMNPDNYEVYCNNQMLAGILKNRPAEFEHIFHSDTQNFESIFQNCAREYKEYKDCQFSNLKMSNYIAELLIMLYRSAPERFALPEGKLEIAKVQKYIDENYNTKIKIAELAEMFYINQYYLSHVFRSYTGYSPKQYLSKVRLIHVRQLLVKTDLTIAEIAERTGYETINDLSRQFKNKFKISPTEFKKSQYNNSYH